MSVVASLTGIAPTGRHQALGVRSSRLALRLVHSLKCPDCIGKQKPVDEVKDHTAYLPARRLSVGPQGELRDHLCVSGG